MLNINKIKNFKSDLILNMKKAIKIIIYPILIFFIGLQIISIFHAYNFTHFDEEYLGKKRDVKSLNNFEKLKAVIFGVKIPRPKNSVMPNQKYESVKLKLQKDTLDCWFINIKNPKGIVLLFHGYGGNKSDLVEKATIFNKLGFSTVLVDFLGAGKSSGNKCTIGFHESDQVKKVFNYFAIKNKNIILFGSSMGAVAVLKSIQENQLNCKAIILECPFGNMLKTVQTRFELMKLPSFPMANLIVFWGGIINKFNAFSHNPIDYAKKIKTPTLLFYGDKDERVSFHEIKSIYNNLLGKKEIRIYNNANHNNIMECNKERWKQDVNLFFKKNQ